MWEPALGGMNGCGTTRLGASKVFVAFKSEPLVTWEFVTLLGVNPCQSTMNSRGFSESRFSTNGAAVLRSGSNVHCPAWVAGHQEILEDISTGHCLHELASD